MAIQSAIAAAIFATVWSAMSYKDRIKCAAIIVKGIHKGNARV